jgi:D-hexose-6-phosphate mutarotase
MPQSKDDIANLLLGIPELTLEEPVPGYPVIKVKTVAAEAQVAIQGAQVLSWTPKDAEPVLYVSPRAAMEPGKPYRGGIPICWPWFGNETEAPDAPQHGFARTRFWELTEAQSGAANARLEFRLPLDDEARARFPHSCEVTVTIAIGDKLSVTLKTQNTGEKLFQIGGALHTYLSVGDISRVQVEGLTECHYIDNVPDEPVEVFQDKPLKIEGEVDRIYRSMASVLLRDLSRSRSVFVDKAGSRSTVVWNPWIERSKEIRDLPDRDYKEFVCIETANAAKDHPTVRPNRTHRLETTIGLRPLA